MSRKSIIIGITCLLVISGIACFFLASRFSGDTQGQQPTSVSLDIGDMRQNSTKRLERYGQLLSAYAADHDGRYPADVYKLDPYITPQDYKDGAIGKFIATNVASAAFGKAVKDLPHGVAAYDRTLSQVTDGTNVLFADGHVEFVSTARLGSLGIEPGPALQMAEVTATYDVTLPEPWKPFVSVGKLEVIGPPFYAVRMKFFAAWPYVRIRWSVQNLTSEPVDLGVQYKGSCVGGGFKTGHNIWYRLAPNEHRSIEDIVPVTTRKAPVITEIYAGTLYHAGTKVDLPTMQRLVMTKPLPPGTLPPNRLVIMDEKASKFLVKDVRLDNSKAPDNVLEVKVANRTDSELPLIVYAAAADTTHGDGSGAKYETGMFVQKNVSVAGHGEAVVRLPFSVPNTGSDPSLVFTLLEPIKYPLSADDVQFCADVQHAIDSFHIPVCWGWFNLRQAAEKGLVHLSPSESVEQRAELTAQKESQHFLFRYRPHSYAERHIDTAIKDREEAYRRLSTVLRMELPKTVTIDLYPDQEAKGQGSGTYWTPANTVSSTQIAEVYNENYQCDPHHELAHLFSYNIPGYSSVSQPRMLIESFAEYFESHTASRVGNVREELKRKLETGSLSPLAAVLLSAGNSASEEQIVFIDFLVARDVEKFKGFWVRAVKAKGPEDLESACCNIYGTGLKELEREWHRYLARAQGAKRVDTSSTKSTVLDAAAESGAQVDKGR